MQSGFECSTARCAGRHTLTIRVMKGGNCSDGGGADGPLAAGQVKAFGFYSQVR